MALSTSATPFFFNNHSVALDQQIRFITPSQSLTKVSLPWLLMRSNTLRQKDGELCQMFVELVIKIQHALGLGHGTNGTVRVENGKLLPLERSIEDFFAAF
jgi:hypothetical protein